jgi:hypothetical protein
MFYDPRISIGMLFTLIGTILTAFGLSTRSNADAYAKSLGIDANLWWGLVLLVFGIVALTLGRRGQARLEKAAGTGKPTENRKMLPKKSRVR